MSDFNNKAVFLDRDGTLIEEVNFLSDPDQVSLFPGTVEALRLLRSKGFLLVVITNQSGVGRGLFDESSVASVHSRIQKLTGDIIDAFYFCPHLPDEGCECRKPSDGMLRSAVSDLSIDLGRSWMVGDKELDVMTGLGIGMRAILVRTGYGSQHETRIGESSHFVADEIKQAAELIVAIEDADANR
jgi:D-glycero-D-manno-heptose 1,7-bisphosphate phosphatase